VLGLKNFDGAQNPGWGGGGGGGARHRLVEDVQTVHVVLLDPVCLEAGGGVQPVVRPRVHAGKVDALQVMGPNGLAKPDLKVDTPWSHCLKGCQAMANTPRLILFSTECACNGNSLQ